MKKITFFPGCGLEDGAEGSEIGFREVLGFFGIEAVEMDSWVCCGVEYSLSEDDLINKVAPIRNLLRASDQGVKKLFVPCSMCYATLKRAEEYVKNEKEDMEKINDLMNKENDYWGGVEVRHSSELLSDIVKEVDDLKQKNENEKLKLAAFPGCTLLRPKDCSIPLEVYENPLKAVGFTVVDYSEKENCCGAFHSVYRKDIVEKRSNAIISSAKEAGADALVVSCPLCDYNLSEISTIEMPIIFLSQAVGLGLGIKIDKLGFEHNRSGVGRLFEEKQIVS